MIFFLIDCFFKKLSIRLFFYYYEKKSLKEQSMIINIKDGAGTLEEEIDVKENNLTGTLSAEP